MPAKSAHAKIVPNGAANDAALAEKLRTVAELLETVAGNRSLLMELSDEDRVRLLKAAGEIYCPDVRERRRLVKATSRRRKADKLQRSETVLAESGIRKLRREKVFTTPNLPPPPDLEPQEVAGDPDFREVVEPQNCYICKKDYSTLHRFYDQICPGCAELNFR